MREVLSVTEVDELAKSRYAELTCVLLTRIGSCADLKGPEVMAVFWPTFKVSKLFFFQALSPVTHAIDAYKEFIDRTKSTFIFDVLEEKKAWAMFESVSTNTEVGSIQFTASYFGLEVNHALLFRPLQ